MVDNFNIRDCITEGEMTEQEVERAEFWTTANRLVRESGKSNFEETKIPVNSNWNLDQFETWLGQDYHDEEVIKYLKFGWPINANETEKQSSIPSNQEGARNNKDDVRDYLAKERARGSVIAPFSKNPFRRHTRISPLDTRPKKDSLELRIILNLSHPFKEGTVNHSISKDNYASGEDMTLKYPSMDDLARLVRKKGKNCLIFIRDLQKAYRQLWMCPGSIHLLGFILDDRIYFDVTLSMGSKSAAYCCQRTTNALSQVYTNFGYEDVNYLDDLGAAEEN